MTKHDAPTPAEAAPTVTVTFTPQEANQLVEALNIAVKAAPNALEAGSALIPIAGKIGQAFAAAQAS
jgi:predicted secreted protein